MARVIAGYTLHPIAILCNRLQSFQNPVETSAGDFYLDNITFSTSVDYHGGIYMPLIRINRNDDGTYGTVESRWVVVRNDTFQPFDRNTLIGTNLPEQANIWFEITVPVERKVFFENPGDDVPFSVDILSSAGTAGCRSSIEMRRLSSGSVQIRRTPSVPCISVSTW